MSRVMGLLVLVAAASLLLLATGCGSDSDEGSATDVTETETTAGSERLTEEQWSEYEAVAAPLEEAGKEAQKTLDVCVTQADSQEQLQTCAGDSFTQLADATGAMATTLEGFEGTVSGACADALAGLLNYARPLQATAQEMQTVIDEGNLAAYPGISSNLEVAVTGGKEEKDAFEEDCRPR